MNKFVKKMKKQYDRKFKEFNFWVGIAQWANQKAKLAGMECTHIAANIDRWKDQITEEIDELSETTEEGSN